MDSIKLKIIQQELEGESDDEDEKLSVYSADLKNLDNDSAAAYSSDGDKKEKLKKGSQITKLRNQKAKG